MGHGPATTMYGENPTLTIRIISGTFVFVRQGIFGFLNGCRFLWAFTSSDLVFLSDLTCTYQRNRLIFEQIAMKELEEAYLTLRKHAMELEKAFEESQVLPEVEAFETNVLEEETTKEVCRRL